MKRFFLIGILGFLLANPLFAQDLNQVSYDSLKRAMIQMDQELYQVQLNLHQSQRQLQTGILVATLGYTVTIIGGQLLGTEPELGEALLYVGGATGIVGTVILFKGFKKISLGPPSPRY
ncbi:hypothetical protein Aconfl_24730 [Algoriphagus confluentis]|uniref:Uncharacterized protein n=2 Tax=Algoriphagus confluentis TaxID=1697556 RepID=A0ABQ6PRF9_9BACT|nr:hypothetical protein Aconfl_24730 [Algoriphagus confluentis]